SIDPGKHTFRFEAPGFTPITEVALIKEGERARVFNVTFVPEKPEEDHTKPKPIGGTQPSGDGGATGGGGGHTPYPWIVVGSGAIGLATGVVVVVTTPARPSNCNADRQTCTRGADESLDDFRKDQERAGTADSQPVLGLAMGGAGLVLVGGGIIWPLLEP